MSDKQQEQVETVNQALNVLVQGVELAQKRGAYNLQEAEILSQAVKLFSAPVQLEEGPVQEAEETESE